MPEQERGCSPLDEGALCQRAHAFAPAAVRALLECQMHFRQLGRRAIDPFFPMDHQVGEQRNQFGDALLRIDWDFEEIILRVFRATGEPILVVSEEHGRMHLNAVRDEDTRCLLVVDGYDGSAHLKRGDRQGGPMFALYSGNDPRYGDALVAGVLEPGQSELGLFALGVRGYMPQCGHLLTEVARLFNVFSRERVDFDKVMRTRQLLMDPGGLPIHIDRGVDGVRNLIPAEHVDAPPMQTTFVEPLRSEIGVLYDAPCATQVIDIVSNQVAFACCGTRKGNLEIAVAHPLITWARGRVDYLTRPSPEAPWTMSDLFGLTFHEWAQEDDEGHDICVPIVFAAPASPHLSVLNFLRILNGEHPW